MIHMGIVNKCNGEGIRSGIKIMHEPTVLKRPAGREGDPHFPAFSHSPVNSVHYSDNSKRNEDYLNGDKQYDLKNLYQEM